MKGKGEIYKRKIMTNPDHFIQIRPLETKKKDPRLNTNCITIP